MSLISSPHQPSLPPDGAERSATGDTMEMIAEMAAMGLPSSFIARLETPSRKSRRKSVPKGGLEDEPLPKDGLADEHKWSTGVRELGAKERTTRANFWVHSVMLYTPKIIPTQPLGDEVLDHPVEVHYETPSIDDEAEGLPHSKTEFSLAREDTEADDIQLEIQECSGADKDEVSGGTRWEAIWDEQYQCYYFCNLQTWESTWDPPPGFEQYAPNSLVADPNNSLDVANSVVTAQDSTLGAVLGEEVTDEKDQGSNLRVCPALDQIEQVGAEEGPSTWDSPPGFELYASNSVIADQNNILDAVNSVVAAQDISLGAVLDREITDEKERDSHLTVCPALDRVGKVEAEEGPSPSLRQVGILVEYEEKLMTVMNTHEGGKADGDELGSPGLTIISELKERTSSLLETQCPAVIPNSHIRFRDSEESSSCSSEVGEDGGIDWEEISVETSTQAIRGDPGEEVEEGYELCSPSSHDWTSSIHVKVKRHIKPSKVGIKKRRLRSLSGADELEKVLLPGMVEMMSKSLVKYWLQRYSLFTKYDKGVKMDDEGWFSVTPEIIAKHQASRCATGLVIDAFTGVGGNAIQFALKSHQVIAIDIDPARVEYARHNAKVYGVADRIEFVVGDFFHLAPSLKADLVFLSPPWGGPEYLKQEVYDLHTMLQPKDGCALFKAAQLIAPSIALFVPRNVDLNQLQELSWLSSPPLPCEVEKNFVNDKLKAITAYYGEMAQQHL